MGVAAPRTMLVEVGLVGVIRPFTYPWQGQDRSECHRMKQDVAHHHPGLPLEPHGPPQPWTYASVDERTLPTHPREAGTAGVVGDGPPPHREDIESTGIQSLETLGAYTRRKKPTIVVGRRARAARVVTHRRAGHHQERRDSPRPQRRAVTTRGGPKADAADLSTVWAQPSAPAALRTTPAAFTCGGSSSALGGRVSRKGSRGPRLTGTAAAGPCSRRRCTAMAAKKGPRAPRSRVRS